MAHSRRQGGSVAPVVWLGTMYERGLGIPVDLEKARQLYEFGARRGELHGCIFLARLLDGGKLGTTDQEGARRWYQAALRLNVMDCEELDEAREFVSRHSGPAA